MMCKMADYFGVSIDFLLGYKTEETKEETKEKTMDDKLVYDILSLTSDEKMLVQGYVSGIKARREK